MGNVANTASRRESLAKQYGVGMIVGEYARKARPDVGSRYVGQVENARRHELSLRHQALKHYSGQPGGLAELQLINLQRRRPDNALYRESLERVACFRKSPPGKGWDGAWIAESN